MSAIAIVLVILSCGYYRAVVTTVVVSVQVRGARAHFFLKFAKMLPNFCGNLNQIFRNSAKFAEFNLQNFAKFWQNFDKKMRLQSCAKECIV